jgi:outer membrane protein W
LAPRATPGLVAFTHLGYGRFLAQHSFDAVLGSHAGPFFGAGAEYRWRSGLTVGADAERFEHSGERIFVTDDKVVFKLGVKETVTLVPVTIAVGYHPGRKAWSPYMTAGIGLYLFSEKSPVAEDAENVKDQFTSYRGAVGVEWKSRQHVGAAFEVQYSSVPNSLKGLTSDVFNEHDLGGIQTRVKIVFW